MNDDRLFQDLYLRYYGRVISFFMRRGAGFEDARDLAQETFVRVYRGIAGFRREAEWSWIRRIATHVWLNDLRRRNSLRRQMQEVPSELDDLTNGSSIYGQPSRSPLARIQEREQVERLHDAVDHLSSDDKCCVLWWLMGYQYSEIAAAMRLTMDAVKARIKRIKKHLANQLGDTDLA